MIPIVGNISHIKNIILSVQELHSRYVVCVGHQVISLKGFFSITTIDASNNAELFVHNLKCFNMGLNPKAKVRTSGTDIAFDVAIRQRELLTI